MIKLMNIFYIVEITPLPIYISILLFDIIIGFISYLGLYIHSKLLLINGLTLLIILIILWIWDLIKESYNRFNIKEMDTILLGYVLFVTTEVILFISFFIALFYYSINANISIGNYYPPLGIEVITPWGYPLLNTIILYGSGISITISISKLINKEKIGSMTYMFLTIILSLIFIYIQYKEYKELNYSIEDSIYGTMFYSLTGFHGIHVIIGTIFIISSLIMIGNYSNSNYLGLKTSSIYWHFVDYVWILLFIFMYIWGI